jgi:hypothetical protein
VPDVYLATTTQTLGLSSAAETRSCKGLSSNGGCVHHVHELVCAGGQPLRAAAAAANGDRRAGERVQLPGGVAHAEHRRTLQRHGAGECGVTEQGERAVRFVEHVTHTLWREVGQQRQVRGARLPEEDRGPGMVSTSLLGARGGEVRWKPGTLSVPKMATTCQRMIGEQGW